MLRVDSKGKLLFQRLEEKASSRLLATFVLYTVQSHIAARSIRTLSVSRMSISPSISVALNFSAPTYRSTTKHLASEIQQLGGCTSHVSKPSRIKLIRRRNPHIVANKLFYHKSPSFRCPWRLHATNRTTPILERKVSLRVIG